MHLIIVRRLVLAALPLLCLLVGCESGSGSSTLPIARGAPAEIVLVMDSAAWKGELGQAVRLTFMKAIPGMVRDEPYFDLRYVSPLKLNDVLRSAKNMLFVTTLDNQSAAGRRMQSYFTPNSVERIMNEPDLYMLEKPDEYARGQIVLHLFGPDQESLIENIEENREEIRQHFIDITLDRTTQNLFTAQEQRPVSQQLLEEHGFFIRIPFGYDRVPLNDTAEDFVWIRQLGEIDKSVVVTYQDYVSEDAFAPENILKFRQQQLGRYITNDDDASMTVQRITSELDTTTLVEFDTVTFQGKFAVETRGLWKMSNNGMGGSFLGYTFVDEAQGRLYYIEGFVYRPNERQREPIRELEAILRTFRTPEETTTAAR